MHIKTKNQLIILINLLFLTFSFFPISLFCDSTNEAYFNHQINKINELKSYFNKLNKKDSVYFYTLNQITRDYEFINIDSSMYYANLNLKVANELNLDKEKMLAYINIGNAYQTKLNDSLAISYYLQAVKIAKKTSNNKILVHIYNTLSLSYKNLDQFDNSLNTLQECLKVAKLTKDSSLIARVYSNLGSLNQFINRNEEALDYLFESIKYLNKDKDEKSLSTAYSTIGLVYKKIKDFNNSLIYLKKSYQIEQKLFKDVNQKRAYQYGGNIYTMEHNLASLYMEKGDYKNAIKYFESAIKGNLELKDYELVIRASIGLSEIYMDMNNLAKAKEYLEIVKQYENYFPYPHFILSVNILKINYFNKIKKYKEAFLLSNETINKYSDSPHIYDLLNITNAGIVSLENLNNQKELIKFLKLKNKLSDSIHSSDLKIKTELIRSKYEYNKKLTKKIEENRIKKISQEKDLKFQSILVYIFSTFSIVLAILGIILYQNLNKSKLLNNLLEQNKLELEQNNLEITENNKLISKQKEDLFQINKTLDKYVNILSHDLRSPLSGIMLAVSNMIDYKDKFTKEQILDKLLKIQVSLNHCYNLLDELLKFSTQIIITEFVQQPIMLNQLVEKCIDLFQPNLNNKEIEIKKYIDNTVVVNIDIKLIESAFRNLISNAIKYTPKKGKITINVKDFDEKSFVVEIVDTGIGMSEKQITNLFDIKKLVTTKGTEGEKGFGFGMILVKENIEKHNCRIWAESEEGKGTTFFFTLPKHIA